MKCIKRLSDGKVVRVSNTDAFKAVQRGTHEYVPRSEWKEAGRPQKGGHK